MKLPLWFLKKGCYVMGDAGKGDSILMASICKDHCPKGYKGVAVYVREDVLDKGLTKEFLEEMKNERRL